MAASRELKTGWEFRATTATPLAEAAQWHPGEVPGVVQTDLLAAKLIPEPFYGTNEAGLQWIGLADWQYRLHFKVSRSELAHGHVELVFDGLDTLADVTLNGQPLIKANNMFRQWSAGVRDRLREGDNELLVQFHSPIRTMLPIVKAMPYHLPTVGQVAVLSEDGVATDPYLRKAPYNFGWDWGPRFVTEGIWKPVRLETWDGARITDFHIEQVKIASDLAQLRANVEMESDTAGDRELTLRYEQIGSSTLRTLHKTVHLEKGDTTLDLPFDIAKPALWNPVGYGEPNRYKMHVEVAGASADVKTGLRSIELRRKADQWGKSFEFVVNGVPVFAKGADTIPFDSFPSRVTPATHHKILQAAKDVHMNMIRSWGGGYYESDDFYDTADELGLMVWQEFMFGGAMVPGGAEFRENVAQEAQEQVRRLRDHPSIVLWCGNNELETGMLHWGNYKKFLEDLTPEQRQAVHRNYQLLFNDVLKGVVLREGAGVPYWPSSPSADYDEAPDSETNGDRHYWDVWHGLKPIEAYNEHSPRFMSEYGFQSFPDMQTIRTFAKPSDFNIDSPVMRAHQKNDGGNTRIHTYMQREYREPKDFASFVYLSQVQQAEAIKVGAEHLRREMPRTMGSLYWQLNDCWPVASWSSIDSLGHWKALQYYARDFYNDLLVSPYRHDGKVKVFVISDLSQPAKLNLRLQLMDFSGKVLWQKQQEVIAAAHTSRNAITLSEAELLGTKVSRENTVLVAELLQPANGKIESRNLVYFDIMKNLKLAKPALSAMLTGANGKYDVRLRSDVLARNVYLTFGDNNTSLSDNFMTLLPGQEVVVKVSSPAKLATLKGSLQVTSLVDAF
ncbi:MAG: glycoside hydrolase family 2 protein [Acidobacteriaceae bacterium]|nr:glycoside hydrolase family 2 protein [Acidobacteriaceae bacterium]